MESTLVFSCYEAGWDGFSRKDTGTVWLHRYLQTLGVTNLVVDSASIEGNRRERRERTDGMDVGKLATMLMRYPQGEKKVWSIVHVPTSEEEDQRQPHRELMSIRAERTDYINRVLDRDVNATRNILQLAFQQPPGRGGQDGTWAVEPCVS